MTGTAGRVTRSGDRVRIDLTKAVGFTHADTEAIAIAPPDGLGAAMRHLGNLARSRGRRFDVGPI